MTDRDPRRTAARQDLAASHLKGKVEASAFATGKPAQVIAPHTALRSTPNHNGILDTELLFGEGFTIYEEREGWAWGQSEVDGYVGYVSIGDLGSEKSNPTHRVSQLHTHVYPVANYKAAPLAGLGMNAKLEVVATKDAFCEIKFDQCPGFIFGDHISPLDHLANDYADVAEAYLGAPYLWGGRRSVGIDCSGLVQIAFERAGIQAPRDSDMQEQELGKFLPDPTNLRVLKRGDLVFWKGHVGIMIDATRMIHANVSAMAVTIDELGPFAASIQSIVGPITSLKRLG